MIKANELRIGNFVNIKYSSFEDNGQRKHNDENVKVVGISQYGEAFFDGFPSRMNYDKIKPIPLTEEYLLKFGFKNCALKKHKATFGFYRKKRFAIIWNKDKGFTAEGFKIKYVHQLQNLYAFTGEELTLKKDNNDTGN